MFDPLWANAIGSIESGGRYGLLGPVTKSGDRAYGKYQVMGSNIGPWTKEVLGQSLTPQQFLSNPQAQDQVFATKFGQAADKYGNPQDAASVWFTGRPLAQGANRSDMLGTTGASYVAMFNKRLGNIQDNYTPAPALPPAVQIASNPIAQPQQVPQQAPQQVPAQAAQGLSPYAGLALQQMMQYAQQQQQPQQPRQPFPQPMPRRPIDLSGLASMLQNASPQIQNLIAPRIV